jgi:lipopolysaccharide transport system permease protein
VGWFGSRESAFSIIHPKFAKKANDVEATGPAARQPKRGVSVTRQEINAPEVLGSATCTMSGNLALDRAEGDVMADAWGRAEDGPRELIIEPKESVAFLDWRALCDWRELYEYRDLLRFLTLRSIRVRYAQSALGVGWAVIQPLATMLIFTVIFGRMVGVKTNEIPYALFSFIGLVPWTYFANSISEATTSLITNAGMISKIYFPRLVLPLSVVASKLVDFCIGLLILPVLMIIYRVMPGPAVLLLPILIVLMVVAAAGLGLWLTATAVQYRDVAYAMTFVVQMFMYLSPVVYPASKVPAQFRLVYALNPMAGIIEGFRAALLPATPIPWDLIAVSTLSTLVIALTGVVYFRRMEQNFADVA